MRCRMFQARFPFVNSIRDRKLATDPLVNDPKVFGAKVANRLGPIADTLSLFRDLTLAECERYHAAVETAAHEFLGACAIFERQPSVALWRLYQDKSDVLCVCPVYCSAALEPHGSRMREEG